MIFLHRPYVDLTFVFQHMLLEIDQRFKDKTLGVSIEAVCVANCVPMRYVDSLMSNTVIFKRKLISPDSGISSHIQEDNMAVIVPMNDMVDMVLAVSMLKVHSQGILIA